jgi:hypothetical protein
MGTWGPRPIAERGAVGRPFGAPAGISTCALLALLATSCAWVDFDLDGFRCGAEEPRCPPGYLCAADGICRRDDPGAGLADAAVLPDDADHPADAGAPPGDAADAAPPPEGCEPFQYDGRAYLYCSDVGTAVAVRATCAAGGMALARIESLAENEALRQQVSARADGDPDTPDVAWFGATDEAVEGDWRWLQGGDLFWRGGVEGAAQGGAYIGWSPGWEPNDSGASGEDCAFLGTDGRWIDAFCQIAGFDAICEDVP